MALVRRRAAEAFLLRRMDVDSIAVCEKNGNVGCRRMGKERKRMWCRPRMGAEIMILAARESSASLGRLRNLPK